uniref:TVP38/TMEM64 family membrane protein n=1 Tax=Anaerobacillus isosaccharinicus TaxID=1532552 RepID=A0A1S2L1U0_9BACI
MAIVKSNSKLQRIANITMSYFLAIISVLVFVYLISAFLSLTGTFGLEQLLRNYLEYAKLLYFFICVVQNIVLPIPEAATIIAGSAVFGSFHAFVIGLAGTLIGVSTMFFLTRYGGSKLIAKLINEKHLTYYHQLVQKNETLYLFTLFIVPILPDEIVCIGAGLSKMSIKKFLMIAIISKLVTTFIYSYSIQLVTLLSLTTSQITLILSTMMIVLFFLTLIKKKSS